LRHASATAGIAIGAGSPIITTLLVVLSQHKHLTTNALLWLRPALALSDGKLSLTEPQPIRMLRQLDGLCFADDAQPVDYVSIHWNWVCEKLIPSALRRLSANTRRYLALANETL